MFENHIGQEKLKSKLEFFVKGRKALGVMPPILFNGAKGIGKTSFAKAFGKQFNGPFIEVNSSTIKNKEQFFEHLFMHVIMDKECVVLFDECHGLPKDLSDIFLTVFNTDGVKRKTVEVGESRYTFDFEKQIFLFATTELDQVFPPLVTRFERVDFAPYSNKELGEILKKRIDYVSFAPEVMAKIEPTLRGNPRAAVKMGDKIKMYTEINNSVSFGLGQWKDMSKVLGIFPHGLTETEYNILCILRDRGATTLTSLGAITGLSPNALRKEAELHLLKEGFIKINIKREITTKGLDAAKEIEQALA